MPRTKNELALLGTLATLLLFVLSLTIFGPTSPSSTTQTTSAGSTVKLLIPGGGHGSGTHIGNGYIITAAHVVGGNEYLTARTDQGGEMRAEIVWNSPQTDISLIRVTDYQQLEVSRLECRTAAVGEHVEMRGNPLAMEFVTTWGRVAGNPLGHPPIWETVLPIDGALAGGMSGGGMFDEDGDLIGVNVGIPLMQVGGFSTTATGISYVVPSSTVCGLLARV